MQALSDLKYLVCDVMQILVFCTTARVTQIYAQLCGAIGMNVLEIHSRKSQSHRCAADSHQYGPGYVWRDRILRFQDQDAVFICVKVGITSVLPILGLHTYSCSFLCTKPCCKIMSIHISMSVHYLNLCREPGCDLHLFSWQRRLHMS